MHCEHAGCLEMATVHLRVARNERDIDTFAGCATHTLEKVYHLAYRDWTDGIAAYERGATLEEVGRAYGVTRQAVSLAFKRLGVPIRPPKVKTVDVDAVRARQQAGETVVMIAASLGMSVSPIYTALRRRRTAARATTEETANHG